MQNVGVGIYGCVDGKYFIAVHGYVEAVLFNNDTTESSIKLADAILANECG